MNRFYLAYVKLYISIFIHGNITLFSNVDLGVSMTDTPLGRAAGGGRGWINWREKRHFSPVDRVDQKKSFMERN